jgi:prepilin-type processing-associated H-X9-DG protein
MKRTRRGFSLGEGAVVLAVIAVLSSILLPVFARARDAARNTDCRQRLHEIGLALHLYARDHDGRFPPRDHDFRPLLHGYLQPESFSCPADLGLPPGSPQPYDAAPRRTPPPEPWVTSYQYRGGLTLDDHPDLGVAADTAFRHNNLANVVFLDGHVKGLNAKSWAPVAPGPPPGRPRDPRMAVIAALAEDADPQAEDAAHRGGFTPFLAPGHRPRMPEPPGFAPGTKWERPVRGRRYPGQAPPIANSPAAHSNSPTP